MARVRQTKFIAAMTGLLGLLVTAFTGKFTGELGLYISGIVATYVTGDTLITRAAIQSGKETE